MQIVSHSTRNVCMTNTHSQSVREPNGDARIHLLPATAMVVDSPNNATAWLIANARRGAMLYTAPSTNGVTLAVMNTPTTATDTDNGVTAVTDSDVAYIVNNRPSIALMDKTYNG